MTLDTAGSLALAIGPDNADRIIKRQRVLEILDRAHESAVLLESAAAVNWYLDGARTNVSLAAPPIVCVEVRREGDIVHVTSNESARLLSEELPAGVEVRERAWYEPLASTAMPEGRFETELRAARQSLLPAETLRYRRLGADAAAMMTEVLRETKQQNTEREVAARLAEAAVAGGADPVVVLVAGESRRAFRHPLPTDAPLGRRAMVVLCARRDGLIVNLTRWVRFGEPSPQEMDADRRIRLVEADIFAATTPGTSLDAVLGAIVAAYPRHGFAVDEWMRHHQGGPAGYAGRDPRVTQSTTDRVVLGQPFTWNPSAPGTKIEDTVLLTENGIEPITVDPAWPTEAVAGIARPLPLQI